MKTSIHIPTDPEALRRMLIREPESTWTTAGETMALALFHRAAVRVPAYKKFLRTHGVTHERVRTLKDFAHVPPMEKKNYLRAYPLEELVWDGNLTAASTTSVSTGSTGQPFFWPRDGERIRETTQLFELMFRSYFHIERVPTLFIVAYAMGMYVAGVYTTQCFTDISSRTKLVLATPGLNPDDVLRIVKELAPRFAQLVIAGYPPFIKDVLERGATEGIDWERHHTKLIFGGEGFSESWRDDVRRLIGPSATPTDAINIYGTADAAILGHETASSIGLRRVALSDPALGRELFQSEHALPSLVQYYPFWRFFETIENELIFSTNGVIPLIRYNIHDRGGIIPWSERVRHLSKPVPAALTWRLPFVYLFGRSDMTTILYGANIYPDNILHALETPGLLGTVSGRFTMETIEDKAHTQQLSITLELKPKRTASARLRESITHKIDQALQKVNAEYKNHRASMPHLGSATVILLPHGSPDFKKSLKSLSKTRR